MYVSGYYRSDGTYVKSHYRSSPNSTVTDNWSYKGNINPYTGKVGTNKYSDNPTSGYYTGPSTNTSRYGMYYNSGSRYAPMTISSYNQGYMEGAATGTVINSLIGNSYSAPSSTYSNTYSNTDKWKCPSGYKRDFVDGCVKGFVANFYDGADAYQKGDYKTAIKHWALLAEHGNADAQYKLGEMYGKGIEFKKSDYWAFYWVNKAAQLGLPDAQYTLGYMYRNGAGVVKDSKQTVKWFKEAGKKGHAKAQFHLGAMYINGVVVNKSLKDAKYWIALANKNGHERAEEVWNDFELWKY